PRPRRSRRSSSRCPGLCCRTSWPVPLCDAGPARRLILGSAWPKRKPKTDRARRRAAASPYQDKPPSRSCAASPSLTIGTRGSPLALKQAEEVRARLVAAHGIAPETIAIAVIKTSGDRIQDRPLSEAGGKGLFTKEIEEALLDGRIDLAVHSAKDVPTVLPQPLELSAFLPREDSRDAFVSFAASHPSLLPEGAVIGTSSLRRGAQMRRFRPDFRVVEFRGNVGTRMRKLEDGVADATLLAMAGLNRLGEAGRATC